jgi:Flp pilus assembly protein TadD
MDTHLPERAEPELRQAVSLSPLVCNARNALGKLYLAEGRSAEAEEQFHRSVDIEPNIMAYSNLGVIHWERGEVKPAEQEWREALRLAPNDPSLLNDLGLLSVHQGRYAEAVSYFEQAMGLKPDDPFPHLNLGIAFVKLGQSGAAEAEFLTVLSLSPENLEARNRLGMIYLDAGRLDEAERQFRGSVETQPNAPGYGGLGEICLRRGEAGAAERAFLKATSLDPADSGAHFKLGALYFSRGQRAEAMREYEAGLKSNPENHDALSAMQKLSAHARQRRDSHF